MAGTTLIGQGAIRFLLESLEPKPAGLGVLSPGLLHL